MLGSSRSSDSSQSIDSSQSSLSNCDSGASTRLGDEQSRRRVDRVDPNKGRCAVENSALSIAVQYVRLLSKYTKDDVLTSLEYHWNMKYRTLNVNTRYNVIRLGASVNGMFGMNYWLLVPSSEVVDWYYNQLVQSPIVGPVADRAKFCDFPVPEDGIYEYRLYPLPGKMEYIAFTRELPHPERALRPEDFKAFVHPYTDMPSIRIHSHPRFVIMNSGKKLVPALQLNPDETLAKMVALYTAWTRPIPPRDQCDTDFYPTNERVYAFPPENDGFDSDADSDAQTEQSRYKFRERRHRIHRESPITSKKRKRGGPVGQLSREVMAKRSQARRMWDTRDSIAGWAKSIGASDS